MAVVMHAVKYRPVQTVTHVPLRVKKDPSAQKQPSLQPSTPLGESQLGGTRGPQDLYTNPSGHVGTVGYKDSSSSCAEMCTNVSLRAYCTL